MFEKFWKKDTPPEDERQTGSAFARDKLKLLAHYFPIGRKLLYYPEYHQKAVLSTIIIGYRVNDRFIYANDAILFDGAEYPTSFRVSENEYVSTDRLKNFALVIPDTSEMEKQLDYITRAELGPAGQFRPGNNITLIADNVDRCLPTMDTTVYRRQVLKDGPYTDSPVILVTPDLDTLKVVDKRKHQRVRAAMWADLYFEKGGAPFRCVLRDFAESALRLSVSDGTQTMPALRVDGPAVVEFGFGSVDSTYRIRGKVFRRENDFCVVNTEQIYRHGEFERIKLIDIIEIKTLLLNTTA